MTLEVKAMPKTPLDRRTGAEYKVRAKVWLYPGAGGWHFINLPAAQSEEIKWRFGTSARGWGSIPITVRIGRTEWRTSLFPDRKSDSYLFAIKADVRKKEHIASGDTISAVVQVRPVAVALRR
jgi:hypothetical protein